MRDTKIRNKYCILTFFNKTERFDPAIQYNVGDNLSFSLKVVMAMTMRRILIRKTQISLYKQVIRCKKF